MKFFPRKPAQESAAARALRVAWGANWHAVESSASTPLGKAAQAEARRQGATHYTVVSNGKDAFVGIPARGNTGHAAGGKLQGSFLAAQLLASVLQAPEVCGLGTDGVPLANPWQRAHSLAYLGAFGDATFVFVATIDGAPFLDIVGTAPAIRSGIERFREHLLRGAMLLTQDCGPVAQVFGSVCAEFASVQSVGGLPYAANFAQTATGLQALPMHPVVKALVGASALAGLCALGWWGYASYVGHALSVEQLTRREQHAQAIRQKYMTAQQAVLAKDSAVVASEAADTFWDFVSKLKTTRAGFDLEKVVCRGGACEVHYRRMSRQPTFTDFVQSHAEGELPRFDIAQLDEATTALEIPGYDRLPELDLNAVRFDPELVLQLGTTAQKVLRGGVKLTFSSPADMVPAGEEYKLMRPGDLAARRRLYGSWSLEGPSDTLTAALKRLPPAATLSEVELRLARNGADATDIVVARGRYFVAPAGEARR